jgi:hypothetical protein
MKQIKPMKIRLAARMRLMQIKKTFWRPLILGIFMGALAGITTITGLSFITPGDLNNAIGIYMTILLLSAALGGPLAGALTTTIFIAVTTLFGPPDMKAIMSEPVILWTNLAVIGTLTVMVGFAYRWIFERLKMPTRLLLWSGIVIAVYLINLPINIILQFYFLHEADVLPAIISTYWNYLPQAIFDIFITSLVFIALPIRFTRPLWYEHLNKSDETNTSLGSK